MTAFQVVMLVLFVVGYAAQIRLLITLGVREDMARQTRSTGKFLMACVVVSVTGIVIDGLIERTPWTALVWWGVLNLFAVPVATAIAYLYTMPRRRANGWLPSNGVGRLDRER